MSQGFKWTTALSLEEMWLNSDREILNRCTKTPGTVGTVLTIVLPNGESMQVEVDRLNGETGSAFCHMTRENYSEWKAGKEATSRRKFLDRQQQSILDAEGQPLTHGDTGVGLLVVPETVQALKAAVHGASTLEEEVIRRIAETEAELGSLVTSLAAMEERAKALRAELTQMNQMRSIFNASKVLEQASEYLPVFTSGQKEDVDSSAHSTPPE